MSARERFEAINRDFNDLPRRLLYGLALFAALVLFFFLFRYVAPFAIGFAVALMIEPVVRWITPAFRRIHLGRTGAALVCVLIVYGSRGCWWKRRQPYPRWSNGCVPPRR